MLSDIKEFVYDPTTSDRLTFQIESYALKRALSRKVTDIYLNTGIFTEFTRQSPETIIKKSKQFRQVNFLKGTDFSGSSGGSESSYKHSINSTSLKAGIDSSGKLSGKNTASTLNANEPTFGFCEEDTSKVKTKNLIRTISDH